MKKWTMGAVVGVGVVGCAAQPGEPLDEGALPEADLDAVEEQQLITNVNADGTWTANALTPGTQWRIYPAPGYWRGWGGATFTGPAGKTRKMGVCLLRRTNTTCTSVSNCPNSEYYCTAPNLVGTKYCWYKPTAVTSTSCAGSPVDGLPIAPGTYYTPFHQPLAQGAYYISYACFEGCKATDPSSSSAAIVGQPPPPQ